MEAFCFFFACLFRSLYPFSGRLLVSRPVPFSTADPPRLPEPVPEEPEKPSDIPEPPREEVAKLLPASLGVARYFFQELWNRCGSQPGEIGSVSIAEMASWSSEYTADKIRYYLKRLSDPKYGFIGVENLSVHGRKRILVNRPTRTVHDMPLFDFCSAHGNNGELHCENREYCEIEDVKPENMPEPTKKQEVVVLSSKPGTRVAFPESPQNREKIDFLRNQEEDLSLYIKNPQIINESINQDSRRSDSRTKSSISPQTAPNPSNARKTPPRSPPSQTARNHANDAVSLSTALSGLVGAILNKPRRNTPGMRIQRDEIIEFVESNWGRCPDEDSQKSRWIGARRVAVCAVDLECFDAWEKRWKPWALKKGKTFGACCNAFVNECCQVRGMDRDSIDAIGREVIPTKRKRFYKQ